MQNSSDQRPSNLGSEIHKLNRLLHAENKNFLFEFFPVMDIISFETNLGEKSIFLKLYQAFNNFQQAYSFYAEQKIFLSDDALKIIDEISLILKEEFRQYVTENDMRVAECVKMCHDMFTGPAELGGNAELDSNLMNALAMIAKYYHDNEKIIDAIAKDNDARLLPAFHFNNHSYEFRNLGDFINNEILPSKSYHLVAQPSFKEKVKKITFNQREEAKLDLRFYMTPLKRNRARELAIKFNNENARNDFLLRLGWHFNKGKISPPVNASTLVLPKEFSLDYINNPEIQGATLSYTSNGDLILPIIFDDKPDRVFFPAFISQNASYWAQGRMFRNFIGINLGSDHNAYELIRVLGFDEKSFKDLNQNTMSDDEKFPAMTFVNNIPDTIYFPLINKPNITLTIKGERKNPRGNIAVFENSAPSETLVLEENKASNPFHLENIHVTKKGISLEENSNSNNTELKFGRFPANFNAIEDQLIELVSIVSTRYSNKMFGIDKTKRNLLIKLNEDISSSLRDKMKKDNNSEEIKKYLKNFLEISLQRTSWGLSKTSSSGELIIEELNKNKKFSGLKSFIQSHFDSNGTVLHYDDLIGFVNKINRANQPSYKDKVKFFEYCAANPILNITHFFAKQKNANFNKMLDSEDANAKVSDPNEIGASQGVRNDRSEYRK